MNYFELYPGDYKRDTSRLSLAGHGAYLQLMLAYYGEELPLPAEYDELYTICSAISESDQAAVRKVADKFFPVAEDGLRHNSRADAEIIKTRKRIEIARENGKKHKPKTNPAGNPVGPSGDNPQGTQRVTRSGEALHTPHASSKQEASIHTGLSAAESGHEDAVGSFEGHDVPRETPNPAAAFAIALSGVGYSVTSLNPDLVAYVAEGGTVAHLVECGKHTDCIGKAATYPIRMARRELKDKAPDVATGPPGNRGHGKTAQGIQLLEGIKNEVADSGNRDGIPETPVPRLGPPAGR